MLSKLRSKTALCLLAAALQLLLGTPVPTAFAAGPATRPTLARTAAVPTQEQQQRLDQEEAQALQQALGVSARVPGINSPGGAGAGGAAARRSEFADGESGDGSGGPVGGPAAAAPAPVSPNDLSTSKRIVEPFKKWFAVCTQKMGLNNCRVHNLGIMGDDRHRKKRSCHNSGEAIDIGAVMCGEGQIIGKDSSRYFTLAKCLANDSNNELQVIHKKASGPNMMQDKDHPHLHVQIKNCAMVYGR